jgi:hypothetical protein
VGAGIVANFARPKARLNEIKYCGHFKSHIIGKLYLIFKQEAAMRGQGGMFGPGGADGLRRAAGLLDPAGASNAAASKWEDGGC